MDSTLSKQAARQAARRAAAAAQARLMQDRLERDKRCAALGVQVLTALRERDRLVEQAEHVAGQALQLLTVGEGVSVAEATQWCAGAVTAREVTRLRRLAERPRADHDMTREWPARRRPQAPDRPAGRPQVVPAWRHQRRRRRP